MMLQESLFVSVGLVFVEDEDTWEYLKTLLLEDASQFAKQQVRRFKVKLRRGVYKKLRRECGVTV